MADEMKDPWEVWNLYFQQKHGMPPGWRWGELNSHPEVAPEGYSRVQGAVFPPNQWNKRDRVTEKTFFFKMEELRAFEQEHEAAEAGA